MRSIPNAYLSRRTTDESTEAKAMVNLFQTRIGISPVLPDLITDPVAQKHRSKRKHKKKEDGNLKDAQVVADFRSETLLVPATNSLSDNSSTSTRVAANASKLTLLPAIDTKRNVSVAHDGAKMRRQANARFIDVVSH